MGRSLKKVIYNDLAIATVLLMVSLAINVTTVLRVLTDLSRPWLSIRQTMPLSYMARLLENLWSENSTRSIAALTGNSLSARNSMTACKSGMIFRAI